MNVLAQVLGKVWFLNCVCYGKILADLCHSVGFGVKTPELLIGKVAVLQVQGRCADLEPS